MQIHLRWHELRQITAMPVGNVSTWAFALRALWTFVLNTQIQHKEERLKNSRRNWSFWWIMRSVKSWAETQSHTVKLSHADVAKTLFTSCTCYGPQVKFKQMRQYHFLTFRFPLRVTPFTLCKRLLIHCYSKSIKQCSSRVQQIPNRFQVVGFRFQSHFTFWVMFSLAFVIPWNLEKYLNVPYKRGG